jgi:hypothetical protein
MILRSSDAHKHGIHKDQKRSQENPANNIHKKKKQKQKNKDKTKKH